MTRQKESLTTKIVEFIQARLVDKLEKIDKDITKIINSETNQDKLEKLEQHKRDEQEKFKPVNWLTDAASRAKQIQLVTHALKYIHCDAKGTSVFFQDNLSTHNHIVDSSSIIKRVVDIVGNAAALDVGRLLMQVEYNGKTLADSILIDDISPLLPIAESAQQAKEWFLGFKQVFVSSELSSHKLAKQVYWPVDEGYHLLSPLFPSSFAQYIYDKRKEFRDIQFSKDEEIKKNGYYFFPNLAVQTFGGTKPQNISQLNSQRGGKNYLLNASPPVWKSIQKPPLNTDSVFRFAYPEKAYKKAKSLKKYLERKVARDSTWDIRVYRKAGVDELVDILMLFAANLHTLQAGWSLDSNCKLPLEEKLWLDPKRAEFDKDFKEEIDKKEWSAQVATRFSSWLNSMLESNVLAMGETEHRQWTVLVAQELRLTERARKEFY